MRDIASMDELKDQLAKEGLTIVDFWAPWCGPCRNLGTTLALYAAQDESASVVKCDMMVVPDIGEAYKVRAIPTLILLRGEEELDRKTGTISLRDIEEWVKAFR